jgi:hypothetical protein
MQKIEIKLIGSEISGDIYITKRGTYLCDINFNSDNPYLCTMTRNYFDGEPNIPVRDDINFVIVDKFSDE